MCKIAISGTLLLILANFAQASLITYVETATATGTLGGTRFTNADITISMTGDTSNVTNPSGNTAFLLNPGAVNIGIPDLGIATTSGLVFDSRAPNPNFPTGIAAGFGYSAGGSILDTYDNVFASYGLATTIGP